jgi:CRP/FNR family cyclic AMP-dependent transcriptional regulator
MRLNMALQLSRPSRPELLNKWALLRAHPFFRGLNDLIIEQLAPRAVERKVRKGTVLFRKGDVGSRLYAVCAGAVKISAPSEEGKDTIFNLIVPGEIFGEIAFLDGGQRTADAVMIESGELMIIERRDFIPLLRDYPDIAVRLIEILCERLRRTSEQVEDMVFLDAPTRLAKALLHLYRRASTASPRNKIDITQREISQMIGVSRESANKQLRNWQRRKYLTLERGGIVILAPEELEDLLERRELKSTA